MFDFAFESLGVTIFARNLPRWGPRATVNVFVLIVSTPKPIDNNCVYNMFGDKFKHSTPPKPTEMGWNSM